MMDNGREIPRDPTLVNFQGAKENAYSKLVELVKRAYDRAMM